jgi:hypothetical protein
LLVELEPEPEAADPVVPVELEPVLLLLSADDAAPLLVALLSRAMLLLTSQHWFDAAPLEPELEPVPAPCAFAKLTAAKSAAADAAVKEIFFMAISSV